MTLDEAIKNAKGIVWEQEELYKECSANCDGTKDCRILKNGENKGCQKCAKEHRQLVEWLKDYKRLLEQEPCEDAISRQAVLKLVYADWKYEGLESDIENLPPVTPQQNTGHWIDVTKQNKESYQLGKKHGVIEELNKIKAELLDKCPNTMSRLICYNLIDKHIFELKGENNEI